MLAIDPRSFRPGQELVTNLYNRAGVKLLSTGATLTRDLCEAIRTSTSGPLYLASSASEVLREVAKPTERDELEIHTAGDLATLKPMSQRWRTRLGVEDGVFDRSASLIPTDQVELLTQARSIWHPRLRQAARIVSERAKRWDREERRLPRFADPLDLQVDPDADWPEGGRLAGMRDDRVQRFRQFLTQLMRGEGLDADVPGRLVDELIGLLVRRPDRFTQIALLTPRRMDFIPDHCLTTAALAIAIAGHMGLSRRHVYLCGLTGLLADVGMVLTPLELRLSQGPLDEVEVNRVRRHPAMSVVMLETVPGVPEPVLLGAYQHHERLDGGGYPTAARADHISDIARIVAVADAFAAATQPRPYRSSKRPHDALAELLEQGRQGQYDRDALRGLVHAAGLFPVGSYVRLSDGQRAIVLASDPESPARPLVRALRRSRVGPPSLGAFIDLRLPEFEGVSIAAAIDPPAGMIGV